MPGLRPMQCRRKWPRFIALACALLAAMPCANADDLATGFASPPAMAKPTVYWHWMAGNLSKEGITADLEEMKRVGIGGAIISNVDFGVPAGPVKFGSDEWYDMVLYSAKEANRLGLELETYPCAGWVAGGTWIDPAHSMLRVTTSETQVKGPVSFADALPQPPTKLGYYRDIAVLAFPTPPADEVKMSQFTPTVTCSDSAFDVQKVTDGDSKTTAVLSSPSPGKPQYIQFEFAQPYQVRSFTITAGGPEIFAPARLFHESWQRSPELAGDSDFSPILSNRVYQGTQRL
jgi:hypothetical protein